MTTAPTTALPEVIRLPFNKDPEDVLPSARHQFESALPFRHVAFDRLFSDELLDKVLEEATSALWRPTVRDQKSYGKQITGSSVRHGPYTSFLIDLVQSPRFLRCVEQLTGIEGLLFDPYLTAGGMHETKRDGYLELHTDFAWNHKLKMNRRLNFLLYLNKGWKEEYNGHLELWDRELTTCKKVLPSFNRLVICDVVADSMHGFPEPIQCPLDDSRKSLALWYYTVDQPASVQSGWDVCVPNFCERKDGKAVPLPRPFWRQLLPPVVTQVIQKQRHSRSYKMSEFTRTLTRFIPPILAQGWHKMAGKKTY